MQHICRLPSAVLAFVSLAMIESLAAQEPPRPDPKAAATKWLATRQSEFEEYRFERLSKVPASLALQSRSLLNWSNPERGTDQGAVFLWTDAGQPQMIACAFEWGGSLKHEFHSLSTDSISAKRGETTVHRFGPGIEWKPLAGAPTAAGQRSLRLTQMRRQAERFGVSVGLRDEWAAARLLPQPVYRTPAKVGTDVGLFVFVQGTDPECVLLVEATADKEWRYALARQTKWGLKAQLDDLAVWEATPNHRPEADPQTPFLVLVQQPAKVSR